MTLLSVDVRSSRDSGRSRGTALAIAEAYADLSRNSRRLSGWLMILLPAGLRSLAARSIILSRRLDHLACGEETNENFQACTAPGHGGSTRRAARAATPGSPEACGDLHHLFQIFPRAAYRRSLPR